MSWVNICDIIYPVGAYYISHDSTPPSELFGGTWTAVTGRFLYCNAGTGTGGSNTHTLTVDQMPSHEHTFARQQWYMVDTVSNSSSGAIYSWKSSTGGTTSPSYVGTGTNATGGGAAHNNMPAYQTVYAWRRTA